MYEQMYVHIYVKNYFQKASSSPRYKYKIYTHTNKTNL